VTPDSLLKLLDGSFSFASFRSEARNLFFGKPLFFFETDFLLRSK